MQPLFKNDTSLYIQLVEKLIAYITEELTPGDRLLSERDICEKYSVSRTTVRQALSELENRGYIYKRHGKGTFVSSLFLERNRFTKNYSFTNQMRQAGRYPEIQLLSFGKIEAASEITQKMELTFGEVYELKTLRLADQVPLILVTTYFPVALFPNLSTTLLDSMPLSNLIEEVYELPIAYIDEEFSVSFFNAQEAKLLQKHPNDPCLRMARTTHSDDNQAIEHTFGVAPAGEFTYKFRHFLKK